MELGLQEYGICDVCRPISIDTLSAPGGLEHEKDAMFGTQNKKWCDLCRAFTHEQSIWTKKDFRLVLKPQRGTDHMCLGITYGDNIEAPEPNYPLFTEEGDPAASRGIRILRKPEPPSPKAYRIARSWIDECISEHTCSATQSPRELPMRLLDLEAFGPESTDTRLVDTASIGHDPKYAALSYCWGAGMPEYGKTTMLNLERRKERIEAASGLPQTILDAFIVTRGLKIRYLWIDALCIVQDSPTDWESEAVKMSSIYGGSMVSIAAELPTTCAEGFLTFTPEQDNPCTKYMMKITNTVQGGQKSNLYIRVRELCWCFVCKEIRQLQTTQLAKRGWAYQERFLAPRILHFTAAQILWECRSRCCIPLEDASSLQNMDTLHKFPPLFGDIANIAFGPTVDIEATRSELRHLWYKEVIPEFCKRNLTQPADKLPAIAGVAKAFAPRMGGDHLYAAGLWLDDIVSALSWNPLFAIERPGFYRAPSFSWACTDGEVNFSYDGWCEVVPHIALENYHFERIETFGGVTAGWIRLAGFIGHGTVQDKNLRCDKSGMSLGRAFFDDQRSMGATEGWQAVYLPLWSLPNGLYLLMLRSMQGEEACFERIGHVIVFQKDCTYMDEAWLEQNCQRMSVKLV